MTAAGARESTAGARESTDPASVDDIEWAVVLSTSMLPAGTTEASYARVFRHDLPSRGARYVMVFMLNNTTNHCDIHWGWSADGRNWSYDQQPLIRHGDVGAVNVGGPHLLHRGNSTYVVYNKDKGSGGDIMITEVGNDFSKRNHLHVFYNSRSAAPENGRAAAPASTPTAASRT